MNEFENCSCGCDSDCDSCGCDCGTDNTGATITLTMNDDTELVCAVLTIYPAGNHEYIALLPLNENGESMDGEVFLYRFHQEEGQQLVLENIEDDEEYALAASVFEEMLDAPADEEIVAGDEL